MTRNRNRNKQNQESKDYKDVLKSLYEDMPKDQDCDEQPDNIVDELPLKQVLARL